MNLHSNIVVTGAAGFIGSCMVQYLNEQGYQNLILVDDFEAERKRRNWQSKKFIEAIDRGSFFTWVEKQAVKIDLVIHLGARTDTTEFNYAIHEELNVVYSQLMWAYCSENSIPLIYASSAATYGGGELGYNDDHDVVENLHPLNAYGISKNEFDKWVLKQDSRPPYWAGLKFFNVYGPNEYHKGRMASVIWHAFNQINNTGLVKLFKSHRSDFNDGEQLRDFIYVKDLLSVIYWMLNSMTSGDWAIEKNGIYNLGTGHARSFIDLVKATFNGLDLEPKIEFIDMPEDLRNKYQYFTEANMNKLHEAGYDNKFYTLEEGIYDYVRNYLTTGKYY